MFKIRDKKTGKFSTGGVYPRFTKSGKAWMHIGHVKNHLNVVMYTKSYEGKDLEVVEFEIVEKSVKDLWEFEKERHE